MNFTEERSAELVAESFGATSSPRLKDIVQRLAHHLHAFVRDVRPTMSEWQQGIDFLTEIGKACTDTRQEFILLSDVLGVSMLVETINEPEARGSDSGTEPTPSTVLGPFHMTESPKRELGETINLFDDRVECVIEGQVIDTTGQPIPGAHLDVWQANDRGFYDVQQPDFQPPGNGRGAFVADEDGRFWFRTVTPCHYPLPTDGPVGALLRATNRHPYRPAHIHFIAEAPGFEQLITHVFVADSPYIDSDVVFAVKQGLIREFVTIDLADTAKRYGVSAPFTLARFDIVLSAQSS